MSVCGSAPARLVLVAGAMVGAWHGAQSASDRPAYTAAQFNAAARAASTAIARSTELASRADFDAARGALDQALASTEPLSLQVTLWLSRANLHEAMGRLSAAAEDLDEAEQRLADIGEPLRRAERCGQLESYLASHRAKLCLAWGLVDLAQRHVTRALELVPPVDETGRRGGQPASDYDNERIVAREVQARVLLAMEDYAGLEGAVDEALQDELYEEFPGQAARLLARLGSGLKESARTRPDDAARARTALEEALADPTFTGLDRALPELDLAELALRASDWAEAERRIAAAAEAMGPAEGRAELPVFAAWAALHTRLLVERAGREATRAELEAARATLAALFERRVEEWTRRETRPGGYGPLHYADHQSLVSELVRLDLRLEEGPTGVERALARLLVAEGTGTLARRLGARAVSLQEARAALLAGEPEHALLVYFPAPNRTHLFVVRKDSLEHFFLPGADFVEQARFEAERMLHRPLDAGPGWKAQQREEALARLRDVLLPPEACARLADAPRWTILGEDLLGPVPFEALRVGEAPLGTTRALARLPALAVGVHLAQRARARAETRSAEPAVLLLAPPLGLEDPLSEEEVAGIVGAYPAASRRVVLGAEAGLAALESGLPGVDVLELVAHGRHDPLRERPAGMRLAGEGGETFFGADEAARLDAPPVVLLAVCGAGRAPKRRGDAGAADLAAAFLGAGRRALCVVQSAYDLDVESARRISVAFHAALLAGAAPAEALRRARAELARDERFADPFHHASMVVVGLGHEPLLVR